MQFSKTTSLALVASLTLGGAVINALLSPRVEAQQSRRAQPMTLLTNEEKEILSHQSIVYLDDGQGGLVKSLRIEGINVQIVSGLGKTDDVPNGLGNLIVGYNELRGFGDERTGSHNLVVGQLNDYSRFGGLVVGRGNRISGDWASVSGGGGNSASGEFSSVSGGNGGQASGRWSSVSGGGGNTATERYASVSGGFDNHAEALGASVSAGRNNTATGDFASVVGGFSNLASGERATVSGGSQNQALARNSSISGGSYNSTSGQSSSISGGSNNQAPASYSSVSGGSNRAAPGPSSWVAGTLVDLNY